MVLNDLIIIHFIVICCDFLFRNPLHLFPLVRKHHILKKKWRQLSKLEREAGTKSPSSSRNRSWDFFLLLLYLFSLFYSKSVQSKEYKCPSILPFPSSTSGWLRSWTLESDQASSSPALSLLARCPWTSCPPLILKVGVMMGLGS